MTSQKKFIAHYKQKSIVLYICHTYYLFIKNNTVFNIFVNQQIYFYIFSKLTLHEEVNVDEQWFANEFAHTKFLIL